MTNGISPFPPNDEGDRYKARATGVYSCIKDLSKRVFRNVVGG